MILRGRCWRFGDQIDTDVLAPGPYMRKPLPEMASHCLEAIDPRFAREARAGDLLVAGTGFGIGSSREQAVQALLHLGIAAVVATSFARIFYRNALNLGLPALVCSTLEAAAGDVLEIHPVEGRIINHASGRTFACEPIPPQLMAVVAAGGLMPWLEARLRAQRSA
jgi:3-isopropylmalate/(R)-2-methylmalate dehydratase small subunit